MIPSQQVFTDLAGDYDRWFDTHSEVFDSQIRLLGDAVLWRGRCLDVGIGSGRFASALGIGHGIDPSRPLLAMAKERGAEVVQGMGEYLPYRSGSFDHVLLMTVICFLGEPVVVLKEIYRILAPGGTITVGFIEKDGEIARGYEAKNAGGRFLRYAGFRTAQDVAALMEESFFSSVTLRVRSGGVCVLSGEKDRA